MPQNANQAGPRRPRRVTFCRVAMKGWAAPGRREPHLRRAGFEGRHSPPQGLGGMTLELLAAGKWPKASLISAASSHPFRFPLTCPRGQWPLLLTQCPEQFRHQSDPTLCHRRFPHPGLQGIASRFFASRARARATLRIALKCPGVWVVRTVEGCVVPFSTLWCAVQVTTVKSPRSARVKHPSLPLPEPKGGLSTTPTYLCSPPSVSQLQRAGEMPRAKRIPGR